MVALITKAEPGPATHPRLYNADLAPAKARTWKVYDILALWMSDVHNLGNYAFAAGLFVLGLSAWQVLTALLFGFVLTYPPGSASAPSRPTCPHSRGPSSPSSGTESRPTSPQSRSRCWYWRSIRA